MTHKGHAAAETVLASSDFRHIYHYLDVRDFEDRYGVLVDLGVKNFRAMCRIVDDGADVR